MNKKIKVFLTGGWGYGNRGDNAILAGTLAAIDSLDASVDLVMTSFSAKELKTKHGMDSLPSVHALLSFRKPWNWLRWPAVYLWRKTGLLLLPSLRRQLQEMESADLIVFGGGGYFNDTWKDAFPSRIVELELARESQTPYVILGQTIGPFSDQSATQVLPAVLRPCAMVAYRDRQSADILKLAGLQDHQLAYTADMAHLIPSKAAPLPTGKVKVGLMLQGFRQYEARSGLLPFGRIGSAEEYLKNVLDLIQRISAANDVHFVMIASTSWDEKFMRKVEQGMIAMGIKPEVAQLEDARVEKFVHTCQSVDVMVSTNMHPVILASLAYIPTVALSYHFKLNDYMSRIRRDVYCHRIDDFDVSAVAEQAGQLIAAPSHNRSELKENVDAVVGDVQQNIDLVKGLLKRGGRNG